MRTQRPATLAEEMGLGPKKTFAVIFIVVGCIAILVPKIFYPMMMGAPVGKDARPNSECFRLLMGGWGVCIGKVEQIDDTFVRQLPEVVQQRRH